MTLEVNSGNFRGIERVPTALDERGLVDPVATVVALRDFLVDQGLMPDRLLKRDEHHLCWPYSEYSAIYRPNNDDLATRFRHLRINRILLPRNIHELLHVHTEPPPVPDLQLMREYTASADHFYRIFRTSRSVIRIDREIDKILSQTVESGAVWPPKERLLPKADGALNALISALEAYDKTPVDLRVMPELDLNSQISEIARKIGNFIGIRRTLKIMPSY